MLFEFIRLSSNQIQSIWFIPVLNTRSTTVYLFKIQKRIQQANLMPKGIQMFLLSQFLSSRRGVRGQRNKERWRSGRGRGRGPRIASDCNGSLHLI